ERLLRDGRQEKVAGYTFYLESRDAGAARLGLLVTRRHAARASERNRIKRCIREAFRLEQHRLGALDVLVRPPYGVKPTPDMIVRLRGILAALSGAWALAFSWASAGLTRGAWARFCRAPAASIRAARTTPARRSRATAPGAAAC